MSRQADKQMRTSPHPQTLWNSPPRCCSAAGNSDSMSDIAEAAQSACIDNTECALHTSAFASLSVKLDIWLR
jgi:hypothetical protein